MRRMIVIAVVALGALAPSVRADAPVDLGDNAALRYWQAIGHWWNWQEFSYLDLDDVIVQMEFDPPAEANRHIDNDEVAGFLLRAAELDHCNFGIDPAFGTAPDYLPHLYPLAQAQDLMLARARRFADSGATDDMVLHLAAAIRLAEHCSQNTIPVMASGSMSMLEQAYTVTQFLIERADITPPMRERLAAELARFPADDPFRLRAAIERDATAWIEPVAHLAQSAAGRHRLIARFTGMEMATVGPDGRTETIDTSEEDRLAILELATVSPAIIAASLRAAGKARLAAWDAPDREAAMERYAAALEQGAYGHVAEWVVAPLFLLVWKQEEAEANFAAFKQLLTQ